MSGPPSPAVAMLRIPRLTLPPLLATLGILACTGGEPVGPDSRATAALAVVPVLPGASAAAARPVNLIRLRVLRVPGDVLVTEASRSVDPAAEQWTVNVEVPLGSAGALYVLEIELIHDDGSTLTIEWSARTAPTALAAGGATEIREVQVFRGPLGNLSITGLSVSGPGTVREGEPFVVEADVVSTDESAETRVFWTSLDPEIASVDEDGAGLALSPGVARIQAAAGALVAVHQVVVAGAPAAVEITPPAAEATAVGLTLEFVGTVVDSRGTAVPGEDVTWTVGDGRILQDQGGGSFLVTGAGVTEVTASAASDPSLSASAPVVVDIEPVALRIEPDAVTLRDLGSTAALEAIGVGAGGASVFGLDVAWASDDVSVATVSADGLVTATGAGTALVTATFDTGSGSTAASGASSVILTAAVGVEVRPPAARVEISPPEATLTEVGATRAFAVAAFDAAGNLIADPSVQFRTSDAGVATVDAAGVATAVGSGEALISARVDDAVGTARLTVTITVPSEPGVLSYQTMGNTELRTGSSTDPGWPHVYAPGRVVTAPATVGTTGPIATVQGGTAVLQPDGSMVYTPPVGFQGTDSFDFSESDGTVRTVQVEAIDLVWWVDQGAAGTGVSSAPLSSLTAAEAASGPGAYIFVFRGDGEVYEGLTLQPGQQLVGEGAGFAPSLFGQLVAPGTPPVVGGADSEAVVLADGASVRGIHISASAGPALYGNGVGDVSVEGVTIDDLAGPTGGVELLAPTGIWTFDGLAVHRPLGDAFVVDGGDAEIDVVLQAGSIVSEDGHALRIQNTTGGSVTVSGGSVTERGAGILVTDVDGAVDVQSLLQVVDPSGPGITVDGGAGSVSLSSIDVTTTGTEGLYTRNTTGPVFFGGRVETTGAVGWNGQGPTAGRGPIDADLTEFIVVNEGSPGRGRGLFSVGHTGDIVIGYLDLRIGATAVPGGALDFLNAAGGSLTITDPTSRIVHTAGDAFSILAPGNDFQLDATLALIESSQATPGASTSYGGGAISLNGVSGSLTVAGGSIVDAGRGVFLGAGSVDLDYGGTITNDVGRSVEIVGRDGGSAVFRGAVTGTRSATDPGELAVNAHTNAPGTTLRFEGGLDLRGGASAFNVQYTGVEVVGPGNVIATTAPGGIPLALDGPLGPDGVTFESVSAQAPGLGIVLLQTGPSPFTITGTGAPGSGGLLAGATGAGAVVVGGPATATLTDVDLTGATADGVSVTGTGLDVALDGVRVTGPGGRPVHVNGGGVVAFDQVGVDGGTDTRIEAQGALDLTVTGSSFLNATPAPGVGALDLVAGTTSQLTVATGALDIRGSSGDGLRANAFTGARLDLVVDGGTFVGNGLTSVRVSASGTSSVDARVVGGTLVDQSGQHGIQLGILDDASIQAEVRDATIQASTWEGVDLVVNPNATAAASLDLRLFDNVIDGSTNGGSLTGFMDGAAALRMAVQRNQMTGTSARGVLLQAGSVAQGNSLDWDLHFHDNEVGTAADPAVALYATEQSTLCVDVAGNVISLDGTAILVSQGADGTNDVQLERLVGVDVTDAGAVAAAIEAQNPDVTGAAAAISTAFDGVPTGTCVLPVVDGATNGPPAAHPQNPGTDGATPVDLVLAGFDPDGDGLAFSIVTPPATGALGPITPLTATTAQVTYTPAGPGDDPFTFQVSDGILAATAEVRVTNASPMAQDIAYTTAGNTQLAAGGATGTGWAHVEVAANVFDPTPGLTAQNAGAFASAQGGDVELFPDGSFYYLPPVGFTGGADSFTIDAGAGGTATVSISVVDQVWYVDNSAPPGGTGRSDAVFNTLLAADLAMGAGEAVFLFAGDLTTTGQDEGITLPPGGRIYGEIAGLTVAGVGEIVPPGGPRPAIDEATDSPTLSVTTDHAIAGLEVRNTSGQYGLYALLNDLGTTTVDDVVFTSGSRGVYLSAVVGGTITFTNTSISGATSHGFEVDGGAPNVGYDGTITAAGVGAMIRVANTTGGAQTFTGGPFVTTAGSGVEVSAAASTLSVAGADVRAGAFRGVNILGSTGTVALTGLQIAGTDSIAVNVDGGSPTVDVGVAPAAITNGQHRVVSVRNTTGGSVGFSGGSIVDAGGWGIDVFNTAGPIDFQTPVSVSPAIGFAGVTVDGATEPVTFADLSVATDGGPGLSVANGIGLVSVAGGDIVTVDHLGLQVSGAPVALSFASVDVSSAAGQPGGVSVFGAGPFSTLAIQDLQVDVQDAVGLELDDAGTVTVAAGAVSAVNLPAVLIGQTTLDVQLAAATSAPASGNPISIQNSSGTFTADGGSLGGTTLGASVVLAGNVMDFAYGGTIGGQSFPVSANANTGGTYTFGGLVQTTNANGGILLDGNAGATFAFTGGMDIATTEAVAFRAINGGTVEVTGTNLLSSVAAGAVRIQDTDIGPAGVTFERVDSDGTAQAIVVSNTGAGPFRITGDGTTPGSGGSITNQFGDAVAITNAAGVQLDWLTVDGSTDAGLVATGVNGLDVTGSVFRNTGTGGTGHAIFLSQPTGQTTLTSVTGLSTTATGLFATVAGTAGIDVVGGTWDGNGFRGIQAVASGTGALTLTITGASIDRSTDRAVSLSALDDATLDATVGPGTTVASGNEGIVVTNATRGAVDIDIDGVALTGITGTAVAVLQAADAPGGVDGFIRNSTIDGAGQHGVLVEATGTSSVATLDISSNTIDNTVLDAILARTNATPTAPNDFSITALNNVMNLDDYVGAITLQARGAGVICTNVQGNQTSYPGGAGFDITVQQQDTSTFELERLAADAGAEAAQSVRDHLDAENALGGQGSSVLITSVITAVADGACRVPTP